LDHVARRTPSWLETTALQLESRASGRESALRVWRILNRAVEAFINNNDLLRASALTFTVALSIVPILALAFSAVKGFGGADRLKPLIEQYLALGSSGASSQLMAYVENVNAAALGSAGGAFLLITVISTMGTIEQALNTIFNVPESRSYFRKFSDYLSVLFTVPFLIVAALGVTAVFSVRISEVPFVTQLLLPFLFVWAGFFFLFVFFPYTKVRYGPAMIGSLVTAVLFQLAQWGYVHFQVGVANYRAIYGALATLPIFLVWIYMAWSVILFGAELTAAVQRGDIPPMLGPLSPDFRYSAAMHILLRLADRSLHIGDEITSRTMARELGVAEAIVLPILNGLKQGGFVIEADASSGVNQGLFLARQPSTIVLADAIESAHPDDGARDSDPRVDRVLEKLDSARCEVLKSITLEDIRSPEAKAADVIQARAADESRH
jgi:membrane protein